MFTHDTLIREHFQHPENALGLIKNGLPSEMFDQLRTETLTHKGIHLATPALLKSVTDLLFRCKLKDDSDAFVHIVLEHKSYPDALVCVQILKYMALIWDHYRRKHPGNTKLPFVIPLVFYHGSERWTPKSLREFFPQQSPFLSCVPDFEMPVYDLGKIPEERLREDIIHNAMQLLLKALIDKDACSAVNLAHALHLIRCAASDRTQIMDLLELFFNYMSMVRPEITLERIDEELAKLPEGEDIMQTWRERYDEYAFNKGLLAGKAEGKADFRLPLILWN